MSQNFSAAVVIGALRVKFEDFPSTQTRKICLLQDVFSQCSQFVDELTLCSPCIILAEDMFYNFFFFVMNSLSIHIPKYTLR